MADYQETTRRIDYVRIKSTDDARDTAGQIDAWRNFCLDIKANFRIDETQFGVASMYDQQLKRHIRYFNVWGETAPWFAKSLTPTEMKSVLRLDYRQELESDGPRVRDVYDAMERCKQGHRNYKTELHNSPIRVKRNGRDSGGISAVSGGKDSDKRLSYYHRAGNQRAACEGQFGGAVVQSLIQSAYMNVVNELKPTFFDALLDQLAHALNVLTQERIGISLDDLRQGLFYQQDTVFNGQESMLATIDAAWEVLEPDAKQAFIDTHADELLAMVGAPQQDAHDLIEEQEFHAMMDWAEDMGYIALPPDVLKHKYEHRWDDLTTDD